MKKTNLAMIIFLTGLLASGCNSGGGGGKKSSGDDSYAILPETTKVLDAATLASFDSASDDYSTITFSGWTDVLRSLQNGDVIASGLNDNIPSGMLRKITDVYESGSGVVVETEQASLDEAVQEGRVRMNTVLESATLDSPLAQGGISMNQSIIPGLQRGINIDFTGVEIIPGVDVNGEISFDIDLDFELEIADFSVKKFEFITNTVFESDLEFASDGEYAIDEQVEVEVGRITFTPIEIMVGALPVVFVPVLSLNVGMEGEVSANLVAEAHQNATLETGVTYDGSWHEVKNFTSDFDFENPVLEGNARVKGYLGPQFSLLLYGVAGPYASLYGFVELESTLVDSVPWWGFYAGMELFVGVKINVCGKNIADFKLKKFIEYRRPLASGHGDQNLNWSVGSIAKVGTYGDSYAHYEQWCDIAVGSDNRPHVVFLNKIVRGASYDYYYEVKYASWNGNEWVFERLVDGDTVDLHPWVSIALDTAGNPHILYSYEYDDNSDTVYKLEHVYQNSGSWTSETVSTLTNEECNRYQLKIGTDNVPQIAYYAQMADDEAEIRYMKKTGNAWSTGIVESGFGSYSIYDDSLDMVLDSANNPHVVYLVNFHEPSELDIVYAKKSGSSWNKYSFVTLYDNSTHYFSGSSTPRISTDGANNPSFADFSNCVYSTISGGGWTALYDYDEESGSAHNFNGAILSSSTGGSLIVYQYLADTYTSDFYVRYAYETGEGWIREDIDLTLNTGLDIEAAVDSNDRVHAVYLDNANGILKYAKRTGP